MTTTKKRKPASRFCSTREEVTRPVLYWDVVKGEIAEGHLNTACGHIDGMVGDVGVEFNKPRGLPHYGPKGWMPADDNELTSIEIGLYGSAYASLHPSTGNVYDAVADTFEKLAEQMIEYAKAARELARLVPE